LRNIKASAIQSVASGFSAKIRFNSTILGFQDNSIFRTNSGDTVEILFEGAIPLSDSILGSFGVVACLGDDVKTPLEITSFQLVRSHW